MRKFKIYLDTSVISYLYQLDTPDKMNDTLVLWKELKQGKYDVYISDITLDEVDGNTNPKKDILLEYLTEIEYTIITVSDEIHSYAKKLNEEGILSDKHYEDCLHIGCAVINECNYLLSWNYKHMVKAKTVNGVRSINSILGYHGIDIYSPNMIIE